MSEGFDICRIAEIAETSYMKSLICLVVSFILALPAVANELPNSLRGKWEVAEVHINTEASRKSFYIWNDPRLVGRIFTFAPGRVSTDAPENSECVISRVKLISADPRELIRESMAGYGYPAVHADVESYRLDPDWDLRSKLIQIYCKDVMWNGSLGTDGGVQGSWLFMTRSERLVLRWYDETILVLDRISFNQKPRPTYSCLKTKNQTENEICQSMELSAFDRSVSEAYKLSISQYENLGKDINSLTRAQSAWLATRNKCGTDEKCTLASMRKRIDELLTPVP
jgi:uncharacterized protein YecT (DUF1311 family)